MAGRFDPVRDSVGPSSGDERRSVSAEFPSQHRKPTRSASIADILNEDGDDRGAHQHPHPSHPHHHQPSPMGSQGAHQYMAQSPAHPTHSPSMHHFPHHDGYTMRRHSPASSSSSVALSRRPTHDVSPSTMHRDLPVGEDGRPYTHSPQQHPRSHVYHNHPSAPISSPTASVPAGYHSRQHSPPPMHGYQADLPFSSGGNGNGRGLRNERSPSLLHILNSGPHIDDRARSISVDDRPVSGGGLHAGYPEQRSRMSSLSHAYDGPESHDRSMEGYHSSQSQHYQHQHPLRQSPSPPPQYHHHLSAVASQHSSQSRNPSLRTASVSSVNEFAVPDVPRRSPETMRGRTSLPFVSHSQPPHPSHMQTSQSHLNPALSSPHHSHHSHHQSPPYPEHVGQPHPHHERSPYSRSDEYGADSRPHSQTHSPGQQIAYPPSLPATQREGRYPPPGPLHISTVQPFSVPQSPVGSVPQTPYGGNVQSPLRFPPTPGAYVQTPGEYVGPSMFHGHRPLGHPQGDPQTPATFANGKHSPVVERQWSQEHHFSNEGDHRFAEREARHVFDEQRERRDAAEMQRLGDGNRPEQRLSPEIGNGQDRHLERVDRSMQEDASVDEKATRQVQPEIGKPLDPEVRANEESALPGKASKRKSTAGEVKPTKRSPLSAVAKTEEALDGTKSKNDQMPSALDTLSTVSAIRARRESETKNGKETSGKIKILPPPSTPNTAKVETHHQTDVKVDSGKQFAAAGEEEEKPAFEDKRSQRPYMPRHRQGHLGISRLPITTKELEAMQYRSCNPLRTKWQDEHPGRPDGWLAMVAEFEAHQLPFVQPKGSKGSARKRKAESMSSVAEEAQARSKSQVAAHYNSRKDVGVVERKASPILELRNYNNWVKSVLIQRFGRKGGRVMELGGGKGGDLNKWDRVRSSLFVLADIAEVSVEQARNRYHERHFSFRAEFFAGDCFGEPIAKTIPQKLLDEGFDNLSLQFCLHYGWESISRARMMLENVARYMRLGGTFIGTMPDSEQLRRRLQRSIQADARSRSFGNEFYRVEFDDDESFHDLSQNGGQVSFRPYGQRYTFSLLDAVDDVAEYVVDWNEFEHLAAQYGLKCIYKMSFEELFHAERTSSDRSMRDLAQRMKIRMNSDVPISEALWQASTVYLAFAFEKVSEP